MSTRGDMGTFLRVTWGTLLVLALAPSAQGAGEYYLYEPKQVEKPAAPAEPGEGVLVRTITIKRGDTLSRLSRRYAGKASYYPQILLFNEIANPNLIYAGKELKVPVTTEAGLSVASIAEPKGRQPQSLVRKRKKAGQTAPAHQPAPLEKKATPPLPTRQTVEAAQPAPRTSTAEQKLYEKAISEYRSNQFGQAQQSFSEFLDRYPSSPLAPDAALYKAESLLKQSDEQQQ